MGDYDPERPWENHRLRRSLGDGERMDGRVTFGLIATFLTLNTFIIITIGLCLDWW